MTRIACAAALGVVLALAGCAARAPLRPKAPPPEYWALEGRLALSNGRDGGSGQFSWIHGPVADRMSFHGALGRGSWRLEATPGRAWLSTANGERFVAPDVATLLDRHVAWRIPVTALSWWVVGEPAPGTPYATRRDEAGRLELLEQAQWRIAFEGYLDVDGRWLPRKLTATREGDRVRLLVTNWRHGAASVPLSDAPRAN